jgi:hypothetical protein
LVELAGRTPLTVAGISSLIHRSDFEAVLKRQS